jgi:hypothetical protein
MVVLVLLGGLAAAALMMSGVLRAAADRFVRRQCQPDANANLDGRAAGLATVAQLIIPVRGLRAAPTQTLIPTPRQPTRRPHSLVCRLPRREPGTPSPVPSQVLRR